MERTRTISERTDPQSSSTDAMEVKALLGVLLFRGIFHDVKQCCAQLWYGSLSARPIYRATMCYKHYKWLMRNLSSHDPEKLRRDFMNDRFAGMRRLLAKFENNVRKHYLINLASTVSYSHVWLMMLTVMYLELYSMYRYPEKNKKTPAQPIHDLGMDMDSDIFGFGLNITGDRLYLSIETSEELYSRNVKSVGTYVCPTGRAYQI